MKQRVIEVIWRSEFLDYALLLRGYLLASVIETCRIRQCSPWRYLAGVIANRRAGLFVSPLPVYVAGV